MILYIIANSYTVVYSNTLCYSMLDELYVIRNSFSICYVASGHTGCPHASARGRVTSRALAGPATSVKM